MTAVRPTRIAALVDPLPAAHQPSTLTPRKPVKPHDLPWLMDLMNSTLDRHGTLWFRFATPVTGRESAFARALCVADWPPGLTRADSWESPVVRAPPNVDLGVRLHRHPAGEWIGLSAEGFWSPEGVGVAQATLHDADGPVDVASCSVVLVPKS